MRAIVFNMTKKYEGWGIAAKVGSLAALFVTLSMGWLFVLANSGI